MKFPTVQLSLIQMRDAGSKSASLAAATSWIEKAAADGAQVICLQELFATCYPCQAEDHTMFDLAESIPGPTTDSLAELAARLQVVIVCPMFEKRAAGVYHNTVVVLDADGSIAGVYRKMHIPDDPLYYEKFYFTPGDAAQPDVSVAPDKPNGFNIIKTRYAKLGVGICWDQWYPEAARLFALAGADILLYPTAIGWIDEEKDEFGAGQLDAWMTSMRAHAIANGIFVGAPNRVGIEGRVEFWGNSFIASPRGELLSRGDDHTDGIISAECSLEEMDVVRTHWPFLRDRRVDAYGDLTRRFID
ncbi:carbon-nitrogen hydrolase [Rhodopirellula sp. SWK7]|uniref:carbon-nitrogen hydrolase n=1 Tax=Rhodopirellula sp. SWK7 TaxID=595460 RepID=UPI0002BFA9F4|nr:carbon-nitrogen hydrolase [Rhodopirellula sp. SWK7]EMI43699.1 carbon-nitrogen hydrolase family protein [Rhodopirellula sp. SWK7]